MMSGARSQESERGRDTTPTPAQTDKTTAWRERHTGDHKEHREEGNTGKH